VPRPPRASIAPAVETSLPVEISVLTPTWMGLLKPTQDQPPWYLSMTREAVSGINKSDHLGRLYGSELNRPGLRLS